MAKTTAENLNLNLNGKILLTEDTIKSPKTVTETAIQIPMGMALARAKKRKRVHVCRILGCGKIFTRAEHRRRHELNHNPDATYRCQQRECGKSFHRLDLLERHQERHEMEASTSAASMGQALSSIPVLARPIPEKQPNVINEDFYIPPMEPRILTSAELQMRIPQQPSSSQQQTADAVAIASLKRMSIPSLILPRANDSKPYEWKCVTFELCSDDISHTKRLTHMRVSLNSQDTTESIIAMVKNFYGIGHRSGVSFENASGETFVLSFGNIDDNSRVYVREVKEQSQPEWTWPDISVSQNSPVYPEWKYEQPEKDESVELSPLEWQPRKSPPVDSRAESSHASYPSGWLRHSSSILNDVVGSMADPPPPLLFLDKDIYQCSDPESGTEHIKSSAANETKSIPRTLNEGNSQSSVPQPAKQDVMHIVETSDHEANYGMCTEKQVFRHRERLEIPLRDLHSVDSAAIRNNPTFSDSGYHSGLGSDTASVCSVNSTGSSFGLPRDFLQDFVSYFGDCLIDKAGARHWYPAVMARFDATIFDRCLNELLKQYSLDLLSATERIQLPTGYSASNSKPQLKQSATRLIRRYRPKITTHFHEHASWTPLDRESMAQKLRDMGRQLTLNEKLGLFAKNNLASKDMGHDNSDNLEDPSEVDSEEEFEDLGPIKDFLISGTAFRTLCSSLRNLYFDGDGTMQKVSRQIATRLRYDEHYLPVQKDDAERQSVYSVRFDLHWQVKDFLISQYGNSSSSLGPIVVLVGSALYAQATTYARYLQTVWPKSYETFLNALQVGFNSGEKKESAEAIMHEGYRSIVFQISAGSKDSDSCLVRGSKEFVIDTAHMLAFTGIAFKTSSFGEELSYGTVDVESCASIQPNFRMTFHVERLQASENSCWLSLFSGASIARDFPIPDRGNEIGLDISVEMMAAIAGAHHIVEYEGGLVIKGFNSMFVPIEKTGGCIQWHLITSDDGETRLQYGDVAKRCPNRALLDSVNLANLSGTRSIVGWCSAAWSALGSNTNTMDYQNIEYSTAQKASNGMKLSGGSIGFQQFGLAQLDISLSAKDGKCHFQRTNGPYKRIISAAEKMPVLLYDVLEKRAWLVSAVEVILHMIHHRHCLEPFELGGKPAELPTTRVNGPSAAKILLAKAGMDLSDLEVYKLKDAVTSIWSLLEFLMDQKVSRDRVPGANVPTTVQDWIQGYEFKAIVQERSPFQLKQSSIMKSSGGWPTLAKDIDALVLFASGLGNVIRPMKDHVGNRHLCHMSSTVPKGKDYLAAKTEVLDDLYEQAGYRLERTFLTSTGLQWHKGRSALFEPCTKPGTYICKCSRLQQIIGKQTIGEVVGPGPLVETGAVIFGQSDSPLCEMGYRPSRPKVYGIYSQPNSNLEPIPSKKADDLDDSTSSESDVIGHDFSDATEDTTTTSTSVGSWDNRNMIPIKDLMDSSSLSIDHDKPLPYCDIDVSVEDCTVHDYNGTRGHKRVAVGTLPGELLGCGRINEEGDNWPIKDKKGLTQSLFDTNIQPRKRRVR